MVWFSGGIRLVQKDVEDQTQKLYRHHSTPCFAAWQELMEHKLVFIETQDVVETTLALDNFRRACDCGRGAVFFSVARYRQISMAWALLSALEEILNATLARATA